VLLGTSGMGLSHVNTMVAFNPVLDLSDTTRSEASVVKFLGRTCAALAAVCKQASPVMQVRLKLPPFLIVHGTADENVPYGQAVHMVALLKTAADRVESFTADGGTHTFWSADTWYAPTEKAMETFLLKVFAR